MLNPADSLRDDAAEARLDDGWEAQRRRRLSADMIERRQPWIKPRAWDGKILSVTQRRQPEYIPSPWLPKSLQARERWA